MYLPAWSGSRVMRMLSKKMPDDIVHSSIPMPENGANMYGVLSSKKSGLGICFAFHTPMYSGLSIFGAYHLPL